MSFLTDKKFLIFVAKFLGLYLLLYYGTIAMIGIASPGKLYSGFVDQYLDYVSWIKNTLIAATGWLVAMFGYETNVEPGFVIRVIGKRGVIVGSSCVGYGVYSFWIAYVVANSMAILRKIAWIVGGVLLLWLINTIRISMFLIAINNNRTMPFGIDHHTWFNIVAYVFIFMMMYFFNQQLNKNKHAANHSPGQL
ncbi:MAG: exosortase/archaeosortase family protein [Ferruginibacter sp.]